MMINEKKVNYIDELFSKTDLLLKNAEWRLSLFEKGNKLYSLCEDILKEYRNVKYSSIENIYLSKASIIGLECKVDETVTKKALTKLQDRLTILNDKTLVNITANDYNKYISSLIVFIENIIHTMATSKNSRTVLSSKVILNEYIIHLDFKRSRKDIEKELKISKRQYYNLLEEGIILISQCIFGLFFSSNEDLEKIIFVNI